MDADNDLAATPTGRATAATSEAAGCPPVGFEAFFLQQYRKLVHTLMYLDATKEEAENAVADAMTSVLERWNSVEQHAAYVRRAAINGFFRTRAAERHRAELLRKQPDPPQTYTDPALTAYEDQQWIAQLFAQMPERQREVMSLFFHEGRALKDIADLVGRSPEAVRQSFLEARKSLRALLDLPRAVPHGQNIAQTRRRHTVAETTLGKEAR